MKFFGDVEIGFLEWMFDLDVIVKYEVLDWFDEFKFGIFFYWGLYVVIGWGNLSLYESYSEWFWFYLMLGE